MTDEEDRERARAILADESAPPRQYANGALVRLWDDAEDETFGVVMPKDPRLHKGQWFVTVWTPKGAVSRAETALLPLENPNQEILRWLASLRSDEEDDHGPT